MNCGKKVRLKPMNMIRAAIAEGASAHKRFPPGT
jgi:hypothetical protein